MSQFTKFFSSSKRPVLIGKTITKVLGDRTEYENTVITTNALKEAGMYEVFTHNDLDMSVTYDFIEGKDNHDIPKVKDAWDLVSSYSKPTKAKLIRLDEMHKSMTGYVWDKEFYNLIGNKFDCLCHADIHKVNTILQPNGKASMIDWERASLAPSMYDMGSWLVNQVIYEYNPKRKTKKMEYLVDKALGKHPQRELIEKFALVAATFEITWKDWTGKRRKVYGREALVALSELLRFKYIK